MKITNHGFYYGRNLHFRCKKCGCRFETEVAEAERETGPGATAWICDCPECGEICFSEENEQ